MKKLTVIAVIMAAGFVFAGCATKGYVNDEVLRSKTQLDSSIASLKSAIEKIDKESSIRMTNIETTYALKTAVEADAYNREQKIMKEIAKQVEELKANLKKLEDMKDASVDKLSQNLQRSVYIFMKQLKGQKESLELAMEELDKLLMAPTTTPPAPKMPPAPPAPVTPQ